MILSDNETTIDRLNNRAIAVTIADIIKNSRESVSIGVHGDWGVGKSSVLAMVETEFNPDTAYVEDVAEWDEKDEVSWEGTEGKVNTETYMTVRFNSWQYLGFEDAKIALMSAIVSGLEKKARAYYKKNRIKGGLKKLKNIAKRTWENLDKLGLVKSVGKLGVAAVSGTWPLIMTGSVAGTLKCIADNPDKATDIIDTIGSLLQGNGTETRGFKEIEEFRMNFQELFSEAHIKKLIVLIDDLDRCLPRVAIETLEAVRMFLLLQNTAFVIAADELMIRYAVQEYFPRMPEQDGDKPEPIRFDYKRFSDKYLEKLIQIPLHIPRLGIAEARLYIMLLLIESEIGETAYLWTRLSSIKLPETENEKSQRSRSFLFITIALLAMSGMKNCKKLFMPENGLIALNVPLDSLRIGSHSTRTTHPYYLTLWNEIAAGEHPHVGFRLRLAARFLQHLYRCFVHMHAGLGQQVFPQQFRHRLQVIPRQADHPVGQRRPGYLQPQLRPFRLLPVQRHCVLVFLQQHMGCRRSGYHGMLQYRLGNRRAFHLWRVVLLATRAFVNHLVVVDYFNLCRDPLHFGTYVLFPYGNQPCSANIAVHLVFRKFTEFLFMGDVFQHLFTGAALLALVTFHVYGRIRRKVRFCCFRGSFVFRFVE